MFAGSSASVNPIVSLGEGNGGQSQASSALPGYVSVTTYIFGGKGKINIGGTVYSNGAVVYLLIGSVNSISPSGVSSGSKFLQWETDCGPIGSTSSSSTTFTSNSNGDLVLVLQTTSGSNWAGYVESTASGNSITSLEGSFVIPSFNSYVTGVYTAGTSKEIVGFWGGIGGFFGSYLWQAGIAWMVNSSSSAPVLVAWWEPYPQSVQYLWGETSFLGLTAGANIEIMLSVSTSTGYSSATIDNLNTGNSFTISYKFTPNVQSGEWILEAPGTVAPNVGSVTFTVTASSGLNVYGNLLGPVYKTYAQYVWNFGGFTQYFVPTTISNNDQFTVNYHT
jgi:hypothetical protein